MKINIKRLTDTAIIPKYQSDGAAAFDLHADLNSTIEVYHTSKSVLIPTGLIIQVPVGFVGIIVPRSGLGHKHGLVLGNGTGVIDSDYRGEIKVSLINRCGNSRLIYHGHRIAQMLILPVAQAEFIETDELDETERGDNGFGSTDK